MDADVLAMMLGPWSAGADPLKEQLGRAIEAAIERGELPGGERLPSERDLAVALGLSRTTIVSAYDRLREDGLVRSRQGSGTRVVPRPLDRRYPNDQFGPGLLQPFITADAARARRAGGVSGIVVGRIETLTTAPFDDVIALTLGALRGWSAITDVIRESMREDLPELVRDFGYQPFGLPALRDAVCRHLDSMGMPTAPDEVLITTGAQQAIALLADQLAGPGTPVALEDPTYIGAVDALRAVGAEMVPIAIDREGIRLDLLRQAVARITPAFVYLVPTYHNPTGALLPEATRRELARLAETRGLLVVEDLTPCLGTGLGDHQLPPPIGALASLDRTVSIGSLSKGGWAGLRVGWIRADRPLIARLAARKTVTDHGSSVLTQAVAVRILERAEEFGEHAERESAIRREVAAECLRTLLPEWTWTLPVGGLSFWVRLPTADSMTFVRTAAEHGVIVRPGQVASPSGGSRDHIRIAVGEDPDRLREGFRRLASAWAECGPGSGRTTSTLSVSV